MALFPTRKFVSDAVADHIRLRFLKFVFNLVLFSFLFVSVSLSSSDETPIHSILFFFGCILFTQCNVFA